MATPRSTLAARAAGRLHRQLGAEIERLREDAGVSRAGLAQAAGLDLAYLGRIERGTERPTITAYERVALALGADLGAHLYPNSGPAIRDRHQARILEALLALRAPGWKAYAEVAVRQPSRGWIDVVLHSERDRIVVAVEIESTLRRLEQLVRWHGSKVNSLPSWDRWPRLGEVDCVSRLLVVRSTSANRLVGREFASQLAISYPAHPEDALAALRGAEPWPGAGILWATIDADQVRFSARR